MVIFPFANCHSWPCSPHSSTNARASLTSAMSELIHFKLDTFWRAWSRWIMASPCSVGSSSGWKNDSASNRHYDYMAKRCLFKWFLADNSGQRTNLIIGIYWDHLLVSDPGAKCKGIENDVRWWPNLKTWDFFQLRMHYDSHCLST